MGTARAIVSREDKAVTRIGIAGAALAVATALASCTGAGGIEPSQRDGKLSSNGLVLDRALLSELSTAPLAAGDGLSLADEHAGLLAAPTGSDLLSYLALCALDDGAQLAAGGEHYPGLYGLAPEWADSDCDDSCQRWVSACVLAHANAFGNPVTVSLRGEHPGFSWTGEHERGFAIQEAAFYGNVFASPPELFACAGDGIRVDSTVYAERLCSVSGLCGVLFTGECHHAGSPTSGPGAGAGSSCLEEAGAAGYFSDCKTSIGDVFFEGPLYQEVVTVYLAAE